jgi:hypothetical protein
MTNGHPANRLDDLLPWNWTLSLLKRTSGHEIGLPTKTAANDSCLFEPGVSCHCDLSALQGSGVPWQPSEAIADRDDPPR